MVPIITVIGIFLILFGLQVLIQRVTLDSNRTLRPNYIGTTYVFPLTMSLVGVVLVAVGVRSPEMSQDASVYTRVALVAVIATFFGLNIGFETGFAPLFGGSAESTAEFWGKTMSDFLRSFGSAFDGVVTERPWPTNALTQDLTPEIREKTQFKDYQIFGSWETLQPVGTFRSGLFQKEVPMSPTSMVPIRAMMNLNCRFFHLHCYDQNGFAVFGGVTENLKFPATNIFTATEVFEEFRRAINDMPPASGSNVVANRDPIIIYVTLNNMSSQAETNFVTEFNRILGSRKLPVSINSGDFRNTTMTPNNFGDSVVVIFNQRPQTSTLQSLASGYSGEWSNMEASTKLKFIRTEEELDELANSVVQTGSTKPVGNDIFTALVPETTGGTIPISRIQKAMELGVNVQCLPLYQEGLGEIWKGRIQGMRGEGASGQYYVEAMRPFESAGAFKNYILHKGNFANCGYILKPEIVRNPPGFANKTLYPREVSNQE